MESESGQELIAIGKVVKPHGIKGEIKIVAFSGWAEDLLGFKEVLLGTGNQLNSYKVTKCRVQSKYTVFKLEDISDRDAAESLTGQELHIEKDNLPDIGPDEYYWHEMEGMEVFTEEGRRLGVVSSLLATGANDVLVVKDNKHEYLIPVIDDVIIKRDMDARSIIIAPLPGLLEINESDAF